jgi:hypothetical protein
MKTQKCNEEVSKDLKSFLFSLTTVVFVAGETSMMAFRDKNSAGCNEKL